MRLNKVGINMWTVTYVGKVRFFTTETDAKNYMRKIENKLMRLE